MFIECDAGGYIDEFLLHLMVECVDQFHLGMRFDNKTRCHRTSETWKNLPSYFNHKETMVFDLSRTIVRATSLDFALLKDFLYLKIVSETMVEGSDQRS